MGTMGISSVSLAPTTIAVISVIATLVIWWIWSTLNWVWIRPKRIERLLRKQGFKGNSYRLLIGDLREMVKMMKEAESKPMDPLSNDISPRVAPFFVHTVAKYGQNSFMWIGPRPWLIIMDPNKITEMANKVYEFRQPELGPMFKLLVSGFVSLNGDKWAKHRKIISPAFHLEKLKLLGPIFSRCCDDMITKLKSTVDSSCDIDILPVMETLSADVLARAGFGSSYQEGKKIFQLQNEMIQLATKVLMFDFFPLYRFLPTYTNRRMKAINKETRISLMGVINRRLEAMKAGEPTKNDLLGILLESNNNQSGGEGMSSSEVMDEVKLFYLAGQETTADLLTWTLLLLSKHPDWQAKAREEVLQVFGNEKPDHDKLNQLKIMLMILQESLRLYPPVLYYSRYLHKDTNLGDLRIPAEVQVIVPVSMLHQNKELWGDDAMDFNPERFSQGVSKATKGKVCYMPFGWGPRVCIGQNFALSEAKLALSMILQNFSLHLSPSHTHAPSFTVTLHPDRGAHLILNKL